MFSAVLGGVIRDILINEIPLIFRKEIYAMACVAGGTAFVFLQDVLSFEWNVGSNNFLNHCNKNSCH